MWRFFPWVLCTTYLFPGPGKLIKDVWTVMMIQYFEEKFPDKRPLLPVNLVTRATVRQVSTGDSILQGATAMCSGCL